MSLFGTSGVRGLYGTEVDAVLAVRLGTALGSLYPAVAVGHDHRLTSPLLASAFCAGAASAGASVLFGGLVPTPVLAWAVRNHASAGCEITASHNPPEYNGLKFWNADGSGFSKVQEKRVEDSLSVAGTATGQITASQIFCDEYMSAVKKRIQKLDARVVVNCNNASASVIAPSLFRALGCEVVELNSKVDGTYVPPRAEPDPVLGDWTKIADLRQTAEAVVKSKADAGFIFDGDADRVFMFNKNGEPVPGDDLMAALASYARGEVVSVVDSSSSLSKATSQVYLVPVGDVYVSNAIRERGAAFGGEGPSGTFIWPEMHLAPDGLYSAAKITELIQNQDFYFKLKEVERFPILRERVECAKKFEAMKRVLSRVRELHPDSLNTLDGIRADFSDHWFLVRPSGTEPILRITAQGETPESAKQALILALRIVREETGK